MPQTSTAQTIALTLWDYLFSGALILAAILFGLLVQVLLLHIIKIVARKTKTQADDILVRNLRWPFRVLIPLICITIVRPFVSLPTAIVPNVLQALTVIFIIVVAWLLIKIIKSTVQFAEMRFGKTGKGNFQARKLYTQMQIIRRILSVVIILIAIAVILLQFEEISTIGTTILASAGVLGIIFGFAAQRSISTIFAGFQIAISQPIRIDDVVIVENEWGTIEEITLTYVVVRLWDLRRLIVPITYFIEKPFQNWTRKSTEILGTVTFYVDYSISVENVREKLAEIVAADPEWDRKVCSLQVVETSDMTIGLRALVSAADAGKLWNLRCRVRERIIDYIKQEFPHSLPKKRTVTEIGESQSPPANSKTDRYKRTKK